MLCKTQMINSLSMVFPLPAAYSKIFSPSLNKIRASLYAPTSIFFLAWLLILFTLFTKFSAWGMCYLDHELIYAFHSVRVRWRLCNPRHYALMNADFIFILGWWAQIDSSFPCLIKNIYNIWHSLPSEREYNELRERKSADRHKYMVRMEEGEEKADNKSRTWTKAFILGYSVLQKAHCLYFPSLIYFLR